MRNIHAIILALAASLTTPSAAYDEEKPAAPAEQILDRLHGSWQVFNTEKDQIVQNCDKAQHFTLSEDRSRIILTEPWADFKAEYRVIRIEKDRILTIIEGETRLNGEGDPVLWWFNFGDADTFWFRQYDWPATARTPAQWMRCKP